MLINMTLTFPRSNDSHRNARNYRIDSQTPENTSHFAMRITLFSSLAKTASLLLLRDGHCSSVPQPVTWHMTQWCIGMFNNYTFALYCSMWCVTVPLNQYNDDHEQQWNNLFENSMKIKSSTAAQTALTAKVAMVATMLVSKLQITSKTTKQLAGLRSYRTDLLSTQTSAGA